MNREETILNYYINELINTMKDKLHVSYLIPEEARYDKDTIYTVIIYEGMDKKKVSRTLTEIIVKVVDVFNKLILTAPIAKDEIFKMIDDYIALAPLWEIIQASNYLYFGLKAKNSLIEVSEKFIKSSEENYKQGELADSLKSVYRGVLILLNAAVAKEGINLKKKGNIFEQFKHSFILTNKAPKAWEEKLRRLKELHSNRHIQINKNELISFINFSKDLHAFVKNN